MSTHEFTNKILGVFFVLLIFSTIASTGWAATYYVDAATGSDSNLGTSLGTALKTIQKAADLMMAGDTCLVSQGTYAEKVIVRRSGTADAPVVFQAGGAVRMKGFRIHAVDYIHVEGFEITDTEVTEWSREGRAEGSGIAIEGRYCHVTNNYIHDVAGIGIDIRGIWGMDAESTSYCLVKGNRIIRAFMCGIHVAGRNHTIENNEISHILQYPPKLYAPPSSADADGMRIFGTGHTIRRNYVHDILMSDAGNVDPHIDCFQTWETAYSIIIEANLCVNPNVMGDNQIAMISRQAGPVRDLIFRNNIFVMSDPGYSAFRVQGNVNNAGPIENLFIGNNLFIHKDGTGSTAIMLESVRNVEIQNNVVYNYGDDSFSYIYQYSGVENLIAGHNCIYKTDSVPPRGGPYPNDLWMVNPAFVNVQVLDFNPSPGSPLIDKGLKLTWVDKDYEGTIRPQSAAYDIGAYESIAQPPPPQNFRVMP